MNIRTCHNKDNPYIILNKKTLEISTLSLKAKGFWAFILSKPDDWTISISHLKTVLKEGRDSIYSAIKELQAHNLCEYVQNRSEKGGYAKGEYVIYETPELKKSLPLTGFQDSASATLISNEGNNNKRSSKEDPKDAAVAASPFSFGKFNKVKLNSQEHQSLNEELGEEATHRLIEELDGYLAATGKKYKSHYAAILNWHRRDLKNQKENPSLKSKEVAVLWKQRVEKQLKKRKMTFDICKEYLSISTPGHPSNFILEYKEKGFSAQLESALRKMNLIL